MPRRVIFALLAAALLLLALGGPAQAATPGQLRMVPNTLPEDGIYMVSGTLDGVRPGNRVVRELLVSRLTGPTAEGLAPLAAFTDLRVLEIQGIGAVDLAPLAALDLERLTIANARDLDLAPLASLGKLKDLLLTELRDCRIPPALALPPSLESLAIANGGFRHTGEPVKALVDAIDWPRLAGLRSLSLTVAGNENLRPVEVDMRLLRRLPRLEYLDITGVWHDGRGLSPLRAPFLGLARTFKRILIDDWRPHATARALRRYLPGHATVSVQQRHAWKPGGGSWTVFAPSRGSRGWSTYGSFWEAADGRDGETETEALNAARRRLRAIAPGLLKRLDFDSEAQGTGVTAPTRRDLIRLLRFLGVR